MRIWIETLGCKVNTYESEMMRSKLLASGYVDAKNVKEADVIIVNTCSVTNQSDAKSRKIIRSLKRNNNDAIMVVCGCSSQNHQEDLLELGVNVLIGNKDKSQIVNLINEYISTKDTVVKFYDLKKVSFEDMVVDNFENRTRAFVKIQDGCNNYCSYCIIPYLRGTLRNKDFDIAVREIKSLVDNGFKEIVLTGIHTGSYPYLVKLIQTISKFDNLERIRISSIEITELDGLFLNELKVNNKICNHLHIPIQSGSNDVLKMMNRKYDITRYKEIINKIREIRPDINITTDLIVGFPSETNDNFEETISNLKDIAFCKIHVFPFSLRSGTAAEKIKNIVSDEEKKNRTKKVLELSSILENNYYKKFLNKEVNVLIENVYDDYCVGHTSNYLKVIIKENLANNCNYLVKISNVSGDKIYGIST